MGVASERLLMTRQFEANGGDIPDVPDPYYGGEHGFEDAYQMLCKNADALLNYLIKQSV
jgi:protein-tyrosine phosphatase